MKLDWNKVISAETLSTEERTAKLAALNLDTESYIEDVAKSFGYSGSAVLASYAFSSVEKWAAQASSFIKWRDDVWLMVFSATKKSIPDFESIKYKLPAIDMFQGDSK